MTWRSTGVMLASLPPGHLHPIEVEGVELVLARVGNDVFAVSDHCPHRDGLLSEGRLEGTRLTCPMHGSQFDIRSGSVQIDPFGVEPPEGDLGELTTYGTQVRDSTVWVDLP